MTIYHASKPDGHFKAIEPIWYRQELGHNELLTEAWRKSFLNGYTRLEDTNANSKYQMKEGIKTTR